eukprot:2407130-Rhodomonas_salina.1
MSTLFNGASSVAQAGGLAVLDNMEPVKDIVKYYGENAKLIRECLEECKIAYYGGKNAPYTFAHFPVHPPTMPRVADSVVCYSPAVLVPQYAPRFAEPYAAVSVVLRLCAGRG